MLLSRAQLFISCGWLPCLDTTALSLPATLLAAPNNGYSNNNFLSCMPSFQETGGPPAELPRLLCCARRAQAATPARPRR